MTLKANKYLLSGLICLLFSLNLNAQIIGIEVYADSRNEKYTLNQFNDSLVFIKPENNSHFGSYFLGKFKIVNDTIFVKEMAEAFLISNEVSYHSSDTISGDSIQINFFQGDYIISEGQYTFDSIYFQLDGHAYQAKNSEQWLSSYSITIPRPSSKKFQLTIFSKDLLNSKYNIHLKRKNNKVDVKEQVISSMANFIDEEFISGIIKTIIIDGQSYYLKISFD